MATAIKAFLYRSGLTIGCLNIDGGKIGTTMRTGH